MGARSFYVYILASRIGGTLYIGVTNDLIRRVAEHRLWTASRRNTTSTGWSISNNSTISKNAIKREKRLKKWPRAWKISLIEKDNPNWIDLYPEIAGGGR
jgi:putative endonuclease